VNGELNMFSGRMCQLYLPISRNAWVSEFNVSLWIDDEIHILSTT